MAAGRVSIELVREILNVGHPSSNLVIEALQADTLYIAFVRKASIG